MPRIHLEPGAESRSWPNTDPAPQHYWWFITTQMVPRQNLPARDQQGATRRLSGQNCPSCSTHHWCYSGTRDITPCITCGIINLFKGEEILKYCWATFCAKRKKPVFKTRAMVLYFMLIIISVSVSVFTEGTQLSFPKRKEEYVNFLRYKIDP